MAVGGRWKRLARHIERPAYNYRPNEKEAVIRAKAALFIVVGKAPHRELAENFVRSIRVVERFARRHEPPFIAKVYRPSGSGMQGRQPGPGRVALWYPDGR